jgi:glycosyltransferase involved in cell wall biosynthesis
MASNAQQPQVSFVVIAHDAEGTVERALDSILGQTELDCHEVIVIDDGSTDETGKRVAAIARRHPSVRLIRLNRNRGRGCARQTGVREARGQLIAMVDADIVIPREWLSCAVRELTRADAVGGTAIPDGDVAYICARFRLTPRPIAHTTTVTGSNGLYRREVFDRVSFDPALRDGEDVALNHALRATGARLVTVPDLIAHHEGDKNLLETFAWVYQSGKGATRQLHRYRQLRSPDIAFAGWLLASTLSAVRARRAGARAAVLPGVYLAATATAHVRRAFVWEPRAAHRFAGSVALDVLLLTAYFAGRLAGIGSEWPVSRMEPGSLEREAETS